MRVLVLMSTFNGERYIKEQIDSILSQEDVDVFLLVRDDGSIDGTRDILDKYSTTHTNIEVIYGENVGFVKSFSQLIEKTNSYIDIDYYAFSDQDDVWLPNKLSIACECLKKMNQDKPILFSSNSTFVNKRLSKLGNYREVMPYRTKENVMIYPTEQGCSMVFNKKAVDLYNMNPPLYTYHDRWICLICNFMGEQHYCHTPLFLYRIHGRNVIGEKLNLITRTEGLIKYHLHPDHSNFHMVEEFYNSFKTILDKNSLEILNNYIEYKNSFRKKLIMLRPEYQECLSVWSRARKCILVLINRL